MSHGVVSPLPRVVGPESAEIGGIIVPAGVSQIAYRLELLISNIVNTDDGFNNVHVRAQQRQHIS